MRWSKVPSACRWAARRKAMPSVPPCCAATRTCSAAALGNLEHLSQPLACVTANTGTGLPGSPFRPGSVPGSVSGIRPDEINEPGGPVIAARVPEVRVTREQVAVADTVVLAVHPVPPGNAIRELHLWPEILEGRVMGIPCAAISFPARPGVTRRFLEPHIPPPLWPFMHDHIGRNDAQHFTLLSVPGQLPAEVTSTPPHSA